jgi:catechol-2,3-dioxygenase
LDHLALEESSRDELEEWVRRLEQLGAAYAPIKDLGHACFICLKDPDGISIELWHALSLIPAH